MTLSALLRRLLRFVPGIALALLFVSPAGYAQIYKWVDENGRTHYSEKKEDAGKASTSAVKVNAPSGPTQSAESSAEHWQEQERLRKQRNIEEEYRKRPALSIQFKLPPQQNTAAPTGQNADDSRCRLARDVLNGAVRHSNGAKTDDYDRKVAQRDVEKYCR